MLAALADGRGFLALPEYVALRVKLHGYLALLRQATEPDVAEKYAENVAALQEAIRSRAAADAHASYRWLAQRDLAADLRRQWRQNFIPARIAAPREE